MTAANSLFKAAFQVSILFFEWSKLFISAVRIIGLEPYQRNHAVVYWKLAHIHRGWNGQGNQAGSVSASEGPCTF